MLLNMGLTAGGSTPPDAIAHWVAETDDGLHVIDVWDSRVEASTGLLQEHLSWATIGPRELGGAGLGGPPRAAITVRMPPITSAPLSVRPAEPFALSAAKGVGWRASRRSRRPTTATQARVYKVASHVTRDDDLQAPFARVLRISRKSDLCGGCTAGRPTT